MKRTIILTGLLLLAMTSALTIGVFGNAGTALTNIADHFDDRPARRILLLGNSRIYTNDMPQMVRRLADSAHDKNKWQITVEARGGETFQSLATENPTLPKLMRENWDDILMQSQSHAQFAQNRPSFQTYGSQLLQMSKVRSNQTWLIVNWAYDETGPDGLGVRTEQNPGPALTAARLAYFNTIQSDSKVLAAKNDIRTVNVGLAWEYVRQQLPNLAMTTDGNHPTVAGSYLQAFSIYAALAPENAANAAYVPSEVDAETAATIRKTVLEAYAL